MAKKKRSMALFEVVARDRDENRETGVGVPEWMQGQTATDETSAPAGKKPISLTPPGAPAATPSSPAGPYAAPAVEPVLSTAGGRLKLSLNYVTCTVAILAMLLLLVAAFLLGRASAGGATRAAAPGGAHVAAPTPRRVPGKHYLVIQKISGTSDVVKKDAHDIVKYCRRHGKEAGVVRAPDGKGYWVWSRRGFDAADSLAALAYAREVSSLGLQYSRDTKKKYDFSQYDSRKRLRPEFRRAAKPTGRKNSAKGRRE